MIGCKAVVNLGGRPKTGQKINSSGKAVTTYAIHPAVDLAIRDMSDERNVTMSTIVEEALRRYLKSIGQKIVLTPLIPPTQDTKPISTIVPHPK